VLALATYQSIDRKIYHDTPCKTPKSYKAIITGTILL
jgi:hypothetical protein